MQEKNKNFYKKNPVICKRIIHCIVIYTHILKKENK